MSKETSPELKMDPDSLYREEVFTDNRVGTIRRMTPVDSHGEDDAARPVVYVGQAQLLTPMGAIPLTFEIEAESLADAIEKFAGAAEVQLEETARQIEEARRDAASQIVIPKGGAGGMPGGGMPGGGMPGGGGIQMP
ncbi:MAG: hypothetical protein R3298_10885 [Gammaproteobacteria bacterium]|nr:hypothetical protein [Gammaproteobacteria bacterium]